MTHEQLVVAFQQLYPTEFKHVVAEVRVTELEAEKNDVEVADDGL